MSEETKDIPYKVAKGNRPKIEEVIKYCLDGVLQQSALDFAQFMRDNKMPFKISTSSTRVQKADYMKEPICHIYVYDESDWDKVDSRSEGDPPSYTIMPWLMLLDMYEDKVVTERLNAIKWDSYKMCAECGTDCWSKGIDRTILNKEFTYLCWFCRPSVTNPDEAQLSGMKRLLLLEKQARDEYGRPRHPKFR